MSLLDETDLSALDIMPKPLQRRLLRGWVNEVKFVDKFKPPPAKMEKIRKITTRHVKGRGASTKKQGARERREAKQILSHGAQQSFQISWCLRFLLIR